MAYIMGDGATPQPRRRRRGRLIPVAVVPAAVVMVALIVATFLVGRGAPAGEGASGAAGLSWVRFGADQLPVSAQHGPRRQGAGLASGFSHDELGAVLAAIHISARLSSAAGPAVYEPTARQQCVGDIEAAIAAIRTQYSDAAPGAAAPSGYFYRIVGGDPRGDLVAVSLAASSPQARSLGGFAQLSRTLAWIDGDWRLQVPAPRPQLIASTAAYTRLGGPPHA